MSTNSTRAFWDRIEEIFDPELPAEHELFAEREPTYNPLADLVEVLEAQLALLEPRPS